MSKITTLKNSSGIIYPKTLADAVYMDGKPITDLLMEKTHYKVIGSTLIVKNVSGAASTTTVSGNKLVIT